MHLMKDHEDYIMYGDAIVKTGKNPEKLLSNAFYGSKAFNEVSPLRCNCKAANYTDYVRKDIDKTKEAAVEMNKINKVKSVNIDSDIYAVIGGKAYRPEMVTAQTGFREHMEFEFRVAVDPRYALENTLLAIEDIIFNPPATIVFWGDGSKTVVKCQDGEEFDPEKGLTMAFFKKMHGNKGHYFEEIKKWTHKYAMSLFKDEVHTMKDEQIEEVIEAGMSSSTTAKGVTVEIHADDWIGILEQIKAFGKLDPIEEN